MTKKLFGVMKIGIGFWLLALGVSISSGPVYAQEKSPRAEERQDQGRCVPTADNILGPYYRSGAPFRTRLADVDQEGTPLFISGKVSDTDCKPIEKVEVEVWQANHRGEYDNDSPQFRLRGRTKTDAQGRYHFETIVPGRYPISERISGYGQREAVYRPRHVHFKVTKPRSRDLITQLYFKGDPYNAVDPYVAESLICDPEKHGIEKEEHWAVVFDLVLQKAP